MCDYTSIGYTFGNLRGFLLRRREFEFRDFGREKRRTDD